MASLDDLIAIPDDRVKALMTQVTDTEPDQAEQLTRLDEVYRTQGIALLLGAGVSAAARVPSWPLLMSRLSVASLAAALDIEKQQAEALAEAYNLTLPASMLIRARYLREQIEEMSGGIGGFFDTVRKELYTNSTPVRDIPLIMSLARLCNRSQTAIGGIIEVVTYNFDRLFEIALDEVGRPYVSAVRGTIPSPADLAVRHVHGFLAPPDKPAEGEWLVFAEDQYHEQYSDPFSWPNIVQLNAFSERRCVFIGVSLDDPYTRRLLEAVSRKLPSSTLQHFAFMRCMDPAELSNQLPLGWASLGQPTGDNLQRVENRLRLLSELADRSKERALRALGVEVIWYRKYSELPGLMDQIGARSR